LARAIPEVQEAASWIREGRFGEMTGAAVLSWSGEISGSGCHTISVLRLLTGAEVEEVISWGSPEDVLAGDCDWGLTVNGRFKLSNGIDCPVFGKAIERGMVDVWNEDTLLRMAWGPPEIYRGYDENGARIKTDPRYTPNDWEEKGSLRGSIRAFLTAVETGDESRLWISGHDLRQALEVAIASHQSAQRGSVPIKLPLEDRSLTLYPRPYRWLGGDFYDTEGDKVIGRRKDIDV
jgi:predicted dehydrogenase